MRCSPTRVAQLAVVALVFGALVLKLQGVGPAAESPVAAPAVPAAEVRPPSRGGLALMIDRSFTVACAADD